MTWTWKMFDLVGGTPLAEEEDGPSRRLQLILTAFVCTVAFSALYGLAAGSTDLALALGNLYKLPTVLVLSAIASIPAVLVTWKLLGSSHRFTDLLMGLASGNFAASLVLAAASPVVALYYNTSTWLGPVLALGSNALALGVGLFVGVRAVARRVPSNLSIASIIVPVTVMFVMQVVLMVQLVGLVSPILPEETAFDGGMDTILGR